MNQQFQSHLFRILPPELRQAIYFIALTSDNPITVYNYSQGFRNKQALVLGLSLPQTCRRIYHEIDTRPFYSSNRFNFIYPDELGDFVYYLKRLGKQELVTEVSFDLRNAHQRLPSTIPKPKYRRKLNHPYAEWNDYLACVTPVGDRANISPYQFYDVPRLGEDISALPNLRTLVLDFVQLQRSLVSSIARDPVLSMYVSYFEEMVLSLASVAQEGKVRMLNRKRKVMEMMVPDLGNEEVKFDWEKYEAVMKWASVLLDEGPGRGLLEEI